MPATASAAPKAAAPSPRSAPTNRAPAKSPAPKPAPTLPSFARSTLAPQPRPKISAQPLKGHSPGKPLSPHIRSTLENTFSVDLGEVRIHADEPAQTTAGLVSARAFTFGSHIFFAKGEHPDNTPLLAHEVAHVVQQQGPPSVQRWSPNRTDTFEREADHASAAVQRGDPFTVRERTPAPKVQRFPGLGKILDYLADKAYNIPGFRMFTIILGRNPINKEPAERSAANILRAAVEFIPGGHQITDVLDQYKVFEKVGGWVSEQIDTVKSIAHSIVDAFWEFVDSLGISDVPHPIRTWERAEAIFSGPIHQIISFIKGLAEGIWHFIRDAILKPIAKLAEGTAGWDLLIAVLGRNPITGEAVPRTAETLIGGFMKLVHQEEIWENIKKANAIPRAWAWFQGAITGLLGFVSQIPGLFITALKSLELTDIIVLTRGFMKIASVFGTFLGKFLTWAGDTTWTLLQLIFEVVAPGAMPYLKKVGASFKTILKNPIGFVKNLIAAAKLGFHQFASNILGHLKKSFIEWLTGSLPGVYIPASLDFGEIVKFVLSVLGLTWANIRGKLVKAVGETAVKAMETGFDIVVTLVKDGPAAAWEKIKEYAGNLKDMAMSAIMDYIVETVVKKAIAKIVSLLVPGGAFIQAIISIYDTIVVFIDKLAKIIQVARSFLDSMMEIASGAIASAANKVESTLGGLLTLAISFLAGFLGLGKIADKVMNIINTKIRDPIDKALDKVVDWIVVGAKKLFGAAKKGVGKLISWWKQKLTFNTGEETHSLYFTGENSSARLMVASVPQSLTDFIAQRGPEAAKDPKKAAALSAIDPHLTKLNTLSLLPEDQQTAREPEFTAAFNAIGQFLVIIMSDGDWGTETNPTPLEYTKRRAGAYRTLYFGPRSANPIPQTLLAARSIPAIEKLLSKEEAKAWQARGHAIVKCPPLTKTALPDGGPTIGLDEQYQINVGQKVPYKHGKTAGGGLINRTLAPYGYNATAEGMDGDHVVEMQIGGPNILDNLWPLDRGENRSSGSLLSNTKVKKPGGKELTMEDANKQKNGSLWLMIVKTR